MPSSFGFLDLGSICTRPGLLATDKSSLSHQWKGVLRQELGRFVDRLGMKGGGVIRMEPACNMPVLLGEGCASKIPQSCALGKEENNLPFCRKNTGVRLVLQEHLSMVMRVLGLLPLKRRPSSGAFTLMHTAWVINRRSWRPLCGQKAMI